MTHIVKDNLTTSQIDRLRLLGRDAQVVSPRIKTDQNCESLVALGLARKGNFGKFTSYKITAAGRRALSESQ